MFHDVLPPVETLFNPTSSSREVPWLFSNEKVPLPVPTYVDVARATTKDRAALFAQSFIITITLSVVVYLSTRPYRGILSAPWKPKINAVNAVPTVPYWIPYLGHIVPFSYDCDTLLQRIRDNFSFEIFALKLAGSRHYMIFNPRLVAKVLTKRDKDVAYVEVQCDMLFAFGLHSKWRQEFGRHLPQFQKSIITGLMQEPALKDVVRSVVQNMTATLPHLIPTSARIPQPARWEKSSNTQILATFENHGVVSAAEVDLFPLIRDAMGYCAIPAIMGKRFLEDFPMVMNDLFEFDKAFLPLVSGVPAWAPVPSIRRAIRARDRVIRDLLAWTNDFKQSLGRPVTGKGFSDVSEVMRQVITMLDHTAIDHEGGGSVILIVFWALNANANNVAFWLIIRIATDADLLSRIRSEVEPYVKVLRPSTATLASEPPSSTTATGQLQISVEGLMGCCPLLKATYLECNRLHSRPISFRTIANNFVLRGDGDIHNSSATSHLLQKKSYLYIPHFLHHISPDYFPDPDAFKPERFLVSDPADEDGKVTVDAKTLRPYGGGVSMCKGRLFAEREVMAFVAGFFALWDIEGIRGAKLQVPGNVKASATARPDNSCRVRIRRREVVPS